MAKYCKHCGLMRLKNETGPCIKCEGTGTTATAPLGKSPIKPGQGFSPFAMILPNPTMKV